MGNGTGRKVGNGSAKRALHQMQKPGCTQAAFLRRHPVLTSYVRWEAASNRIWILKKASDAIIRAVGIIASSFITKSPPKIVSLGQIKILERVHGREGDKGRGFKERIISVGCVAKSRFKYECLATGMSRMRLVCAVRRLGPLSRDSHRL